MSFFRPILQEAGLSEQQWRVLRHLNEVGSMEPNQIATQCHILRPSLARMLAGMDEAGLITRQRSSQDQRRHEICLTPKSRELIARMRQQVDAQYFRLEQKIGKDRLDGLYRDIDEAMALLESDGPASQR